ncbi:MAG: 1-phosphofructokinase [Lachnospiraceae bacterium]|nr:1-phosphofructokinase [Lachnospiraceae bacterium]
MIYTITFNPALDYVMEVDNFELGLVNRSKKEYSLCGGKGINVSIVLKNLGYESTALGFIAGFIGDEIDAKVRDKGIATDFVKLEKGESRINVKLMSNLETEINGVGPIICEDNMEQLYKKIDLLKEGDILVIAGSVPKIEGMESTRVYANIMEHVANKDIKVVVDATKDNLIQVLEHKPFLIKPNQHELSELCGVRCETITDVIHHGRKLREKGALNVLVSLAGGGAVLISEEDTYYMKAPQGQCINSVGAGDSMVAGFIAHFIETKNYEESLKYAIATGSASAFSNCLATKEEVEKLIDQVKLIG